MAPSSVYPVYVSPDGDREQIAPTPSREVRLRHAGWRLKSQPRRRRTNADLSRWENIAPDPGENTPNAKPDSKSTSE